MKQKNFLLLVVVAILLTGCVVKSLKPFYTEDTLAYDASLIGKWKDDKKGTWEIVPMKEMMQNFIFGKKEKGEKIIKNLNDSIKSVKVDGKVTVSKPPQEQFWEEDAYAVIYKEKGGGNVESLFMVVPFKIKGQLFLDFTPFDIEGVNGLSNFAGMHYVGIHTLAKLDKKGDELEISWLSESKIQELFEEKKIRIAHEKVGVGSDEILLTATSDELQKFIAKYMDSPDAEKWTTSVKRTLKRIK